MVLTYHDNDFAELEHEEEVMKSLRSHKIEPGRLYFFPKPTSMEEMQSPAHQRRMKEGPVAILNVLEYRSANAMGSAMIKHALYCTAGAVVAVHVSSCARLEKRVEMGAITTLAFHGGVQWCHYIWYHYPLKVTLLQTFDSVIYAAITAVVIRHQLRK